MTEPRVDARTRAGAQQAWTGVGQEGKLPVRPEAATAGGARGEGATDGPTRFRLWRGRVLRVARDLLIGAVLTAMVPIAFSAATRSQVVQYYGWGAGNTMQKLREAEQSRHLMAPRSAAIGAEEAGKLLVALGLPNRRQRAMFPEHPSDRAYSRPWTTLAIPQRLSRGGSSWNGPSTLKVLKWVQSGLSAEEVAYLRAIAEAPLWDAYDRVATAPTVDLIGGRFQLPFRPDARSMQMPIWGFASSKELAYASVSRAAYYLAIGKPDVAEAVLRRTINFGFVFIDNASNLTDALIGRVIVGTGRSALAELFSITKDPRALDVINAGKEVKLPPGSNPRPSSFGVLRERLLAEATNSSFPRAIRMENLQRLASSSCLNTRDLVLGPRQDVRDAFEQARRELGRTAGERALLDLMEGTVARRAPEQPPPPNMVVRVMVGTSEIASIIWGNPRFSACSRMPF